MPEPEVCLTGQEQSYADDKTTPIKRLVQDLC